MPEWMHNRAEHILAKNPSMPKSEAFAIATQQMHAVGKGPKGYGTAEGKATAKEKYDTPKDDQKVSNPGGLTSPKMEKKSMDEILMRALYDELSKIAGMPPPLPAAAKLQGLVKSLPKPKLYGEEGFQHLLHGARAAPSNPFATMKMGAAVRDELAKIAGAVERAKSVGKHVLEHAGEAVHGFAKHRLDPAFDVVHGVMLGDTKRMAHGAGGIASGAAIYHSGKKSGRLEEAEKKAMSTFQTAHVLGNMPVLSGAAKAGGGVLNAAKKIAPAAAPTGEAAAALAHLGVGRLRG